MSLFEVIIYVFACIGLLATLLGIYCWISGKCKEVPAELTEEEHKKLDDEFKHIRSERPSIVRNGFGIGLLWLLTWLLIAAIVAVFIYFAIGGEVEKWLTMLVLIVNLIPLGLVLQVLRMVRTRNAHLKRLYSFLESRKS